MAHESSRWSPAAISEYYAERVPKLKQSGSGEWRGRCPIHDGDRDSFAVSPQSGRWYCHSECERGGGIIALEMELTGADHDDAIATVRRIIGRASHRAESVRASETTASSPDSSSQTAAAEVRQAIAEYVYVDEDGEPIFRAVRREHGEGEDRKKSFLMQRFEDGRWINGLKGCRLVPYHLDEVTRSKTVFLAEGEKDADTVRRKFRLRATTSPMGAGHWRPEFNPIFEDKNVIILLDNDLAGRKHALAEAEGTLPFAASVRVVELPNLPEKGDVTDWARMGGTRGELVSLVRRTKRLDKDKLDQLRQRWDLEDTVGVPQYGDDSLARELTTRFGNDLRYTAAWGRWSIWNGSFWKTDLTLAVFDRARKVCRVASASCGDPRMAQRVASAVTVAALERLARSDRHQAATVEQWDADPWLLNTPAGVVDLRTGEIRPALREDYMTKTTAAAPGSECPIWLSFLDRITSGNRQLQAFLQRVCGYALTGVTREHALFFLYGTGGNGKGVFVNTISGIMGDYAKAAPIETFIDSNRQNHPTDLAGLQGARLVTAVETEDGRRWAESKLKAITGGDRIAARFMRQDFFEFIPQFKLVIAGNHKPGLRTVDEAMRRRFNLLPFTVTIPATERDPELTEKLRAEWGGILGWMTRGCRKWQREGLNPPDVVVEATNEYFEAEDTFARWLEERTVPKADSWEPSKGLFNNWKEWAEANNEYVGSQKRLAENLIAHGLQYQS